jgi:hypothetical protein
MRGALVYGLAPSFFGWTSRRMTNLRTYDMLSANVAVSDSASAQY